MKRGLCTLVFLLLCARAAAADVKPPIYLWFEPEWFDGVKGSFAYWTGKAQPTGSWGIAGPGISAEWTQGGESEWNSMGAAAAETSARCQRDFIVPRAGTYKVWVRYVDHRRKTEPFRVIIEQQGKPVLFGELGVQPVVPANDEFQLFWGFSFGWGSLTAKLDKGPAQLILAIDKAGEAWRQLDAVVLTDDSSYVPVAREKPPFAYEKAIQLEPKNGAGWRGTGKGLEPARKPIKLAGRDFSMWTGVGVDPKWWAKQDVNTLSLYDVLFEFSPPNDIRDKFHKQFAGRKDVPIMSWPKLLPGFHLGPSPDLSPGTPLRQWLERTKTPFYILTNYATGKYDMKNGPATYTALTGPLSEQFLGFIHGEAIGAGGVSSLKEPQGMSRRDHVDGLARHLLQQQAAAWSKIFKTAVPESFWSRGISCLSAESIALAHLFHDMGARVVGYEEDSTNVHVPMRIAFERGAARQYGGAWINYASGNFGDACNYFSYNSHLPRGTRAWFHSKYSETDGVSISWYRKLYYLNYLSGASAIYWEQSLVNQYMLPGPGEHPIQLSPFGRATEDFQAFVDRLPDRGEPITPLAVLLSYGHGYERVNYRCKMLDLFPENRHDLELRELFNVLWYPSGVLEGKPATPDVQSMPTGVYGNIYDVLVDRPERAAALFNYPIVWAAGDADLSGKWQPIVDQYLQKGGTLILNVATAKTVSPKVLGLKMTGKQTVAEEWSSEEGSTQAATPFEVAAVELAGATPLVWAKIADQKLPLITRHQVGAGALIVILVPNLIGQDERAHPAVPYLMNGLTRKLLPVEVRLADGSRPNGEVMYQVNKTKDGYVVALFNQRGIDKTQSGIARVDRRAYVDVLIRTQLPVKSAREYTEPRDLAVMPGKEGREIRLRVPAGDVQVVQVTTGW